MSKPRRPEDGEDVRRRLLLFLAATDGLSPREIADALGRTAAGEYGTAVEAICSGLHENNSRISGGESENLTNLVLALGLPEACSNRVIEQTDAKLPPPPRAGFNEPGNASENVEDVDSLAASVLESSGRPVEDSRALAGARNRETAALRSWGVWGGCPSSPPCPSSMTTPGGGGAPTTAPDATTSRTGSFAGFSSTPPRSRNHLNPTSSMSFNWWGEGSGQLPSPFCAPRSTNEDFHLTGGGPRRSSRRARFSASMSGNCSHPGNEEDPEDQGVPRQRRIPRPRDRNPTSHQDAAMARPPLILP